MIDERRKMKPYLTRRSINQKKSNGLPIKRTVSNNNKAAKQRRTYVGWLRYVAVIVIAFFMVLLCIAIEKVDDTHSFSSSISSPSLTLASATLLKKDFLRRGQYDKSDSEEKLKTSANAAGVLNVPKKQPLVAGLTSNDATTTTTTKKSDPSKPSSRTRRNRDQVSNTKPAEPVDKSNSLLLRFHPSLQVEHGSSRNNVIDHSNGAHLGRQITEEKKVKQQIAQQKMEDRQRNKEIFLQQAKQHQGKKLKISTKIGEPALVMDDKNRKKAVPPPDKAQHGVEPFFSAAKKVEQVPARTNTRGTRGQKTAYFVVIDNPQECNRLANEPTLSGILAGAAILRHSIAIRATKGGGDARTNNKNESYKNTDAFALLPTNEINSEYDACEKALHGIGYKVLKKSLLTSGANEDILPSDFYKLMAWSMDENMYGAVVVMDLEQFILRKDFLPLMAEWLIKRGRSIDYPEDEIKDFLLVKDDASDKSNKDVNLLSIPKMIEGDEGMKFNPKSIDASFLFVLRPSQTVFREMLREVEQEQQRHEPMNLSEFLSNFLHLSSSSSLSHLPLNPCLFGRSGMPIEASCANVKDEDVVVASFLPNVTSPPPWTCPNVLSSTTTNTRILYLHKEWHRVRLNLETQVYGRDMITLQRYGNGHAWPYSKSLGYCQGPGEFVPLQPPLSRRSQLARAYAKNIKTNIGGLDG